MSSSIEKKISTIHFSSVSLSAVHIRDFHIFQLFIHHLTGFIWNQHKDQLPVGMLAQSLGRALHRYRRGHGSKSRTSRQYFLQALFSQLLKQCSLPQRSLSYSRFYPQFTYVIFIYSKSLIIMIMKYLVYQFFVLNTFSRHL